MLIQCLDPIHLATISGVKDVVSLLLSKGAHANARDRGGRTALHYAISNNYLDILIQLLSNGKTLSSVFVLIFVGGDLGVVDNQGAAPIDILHKQLKESKLQGQPSKISEIHTWGTYMHCVELVPISIGGGSNYALGHGSLESKPSPKKVKDLSGNTISSVACSKLHTVVATSNGTAYAWGFGKGGRLGLGHESCIVVPTLVPLNAVILVACSSVHTAFVTRNGSLYTCGVNTDGQLGTGKPSEFQLTPKRVSFPQYAAGDINIVGAALGPTHTIALSSTGRCWSWGCGTEGQLGLGCGNYNSYCEPHMMPLFAGTSLHAAAIAANQSYTLVSAAECADIYLFGKGRSQEAKVALTVPKDARILNMATSADRAVCVASTGDIFFWKVITTGPSDNSALPCGIADIGGLKAVWAATSDTNFLFTTDNGAVYEQSYSVPPPSGRKQVTIQRGSMVVASGMHSAIIAKTATSLSPLPEPAFPLDFSSAVGSHEFSDMSFLLSSGEQIPAHRIFVSRSAEWGSINEDDVIKFEADRDGLLRLLKQLYTDGKEGKHSKPLIPMQSHLVLCLQSGKFSDMTLTEADTGATCNVHRVILCARSEFFRAMLCGNMREALSREATISVPNDLLLVLVTFLYTNKICGQNFDKSCLAPLTSIPVVTTRLSLVAIADQLMLPHLLVRAVNRVAETLSVDNVISVAHIADSFEGPLLEACLRYIGVNLDILLMTGALEQLSDHLLLKLGDMLYNNSSDPHGRVNKQGSTMEIRCETPIDPKKKIKGLKKKLVQILALERKSLQETLTSAEQACLYIKQEVIDKLENLGVSTSEVVNDFDSKQSAVEPAPPELVQQTTTDPITPSTTPSKKKKYKKIAGFDSALIAEALCPTVVTQPVATTPFSWKSQSTKSKPTLADIQKEEQLSKSAPSATVFPLPAPSITTKTTKTSPRATQAAQPPDVPPGVTIKSKSKSQKTSKKAAEAVTAAPVWGNTVAAGPAQPTSFASILAEEAAKPVPSHTTNWASGKNLNTRRAEPTKSNPKSLVKIQAEEKAMQQITNMYSKKGVFVDIKLATSL